MPRTPNSRLGRNVGLEKSMARSGGTPLYRQSRAGTAQADLSVARAGSRLRTRRRLGRLDGGRIRGRLRLGCRCPAAPDVPELLELRAHLGRNLHALQVPQAAAVLLDLRQ